jgi:3-oxoacyl-[acyl-carrier-protein] synthase-3
MTQSRILGTGHAVPDRVVTNHDLAAMMDTSDEWIQQRTGIRERHWVAPGESGASLARTAAERALSAAGISAAEVEAIIYATTSPDHTAPGNGVFLQRELGFGLIPAIDIRTQCSGFVYSLSIADAYIRSGVFRTVLVVGAEVQSTGLDRSTRGRDTAVIFADGAGAAVVQATDHQGESAFLAWDLHAEGAHAEKLWVDAPGAIYDPRNRPDILEAQGWPFMEGKEVFRHATTRMPESVQTALAKAGLSTAEVSLLIPHQANQRISEMVRRALDLREEQVYNNIDRFGNTTAATIPIALDECVRAGRVRRGDILVFTAFGSGFLWGSVVLRY